MFSAPASRDPSDEYEETVFLVELQGLYDTETIEHDVDQGQCRVSALDTDQPVIQVGSSIFVGRWESTPGTDILFREVPHRQMLSFIGSSEKRLIAQRVLLNAKRKRTNEDDDEVEEDEGGDVRYGDEEVESGTAAQQREGAATNGEVQGEEAGSQDRNEAMMNDGRTPEGEGVPP